MPVAWWQKRAAETVMEKGFGMVQYARQHVVGRNVEMRA